MDSILKAILKVAGVGLGLASVVFLGIVITTHLGIATMPYRPFMVVIILIVTMLYGYKQYTSYEPEMEMVEMAVPEKLEETPPSEYFDEEV